VRRDAAIVADLAGTTRDVIEVQLELAGLPVTACDTAGLRPEGAVADAVEREGIRRARARFAAADIALLVLDAAVLAGLEGPAATAEAAAAVAEALKLRGGLGTPADGRLAVVLSKADRLAGAAGARAAALVRLAELLAAADAPVDRHLRVAGVHSRMLVSCKPGVAEAEAEAGVAGLVAWLAEAGGELAGGRLHPSGGGDDDLDAVPTRARHVVELRSCLEALASFEALLADEVRHARWPVWSARGAGRA
jgi:hypothetical protein